VKAYLRKKARVTSPAGADSDDSKDPASVSEDGSEVTEREEEASHS
jgi:hypothetical protein